MRPFWNRTLSKNLNTFETIHWPTVDQAEVDTYDAAIQKLMNGFALIAIDGCIRMMAFSVQGFSFRGISEPQNEMTQRGSREALSNRS